MKVFTLRQRRCLIFWRTVSSPFRRLSQSLLFLTLTLGYAQAQNPLAPAGQFNIFTQGNVTLTNNESEGPVAIGGNVIITGNYNIANNFAGNFTQAAFPNVKIGLVVGGGVKLENGILRVLNKTFMKIGNCAGGAGADALRVWYRDQNNATTPIRATKTGVGFNPSSFVELNGNVNDFYTALADTAANPVCQANVIDFASAFTALKATSNTLIACQNTIRATDPNGNPITNYSGQNLRLRDPVGGQPANTTRVFNISGSDLNAINELALEFTPTASQPLLINVTTGATFDWAVKNQNVGGTMKYIIWNFPNVTTLNVVGFATIEGSVLAPNAAVFKNTTNNSNIEGQLIAQTFTMNGGEMHHFPFEGNLNCGTPPVCNAPTPTAANVERCGPGTVSFTATGCTTGFTPKWYGDTNLGTQVGSGTPFTTVSLTTTTDYYLACVKNDDASCKSTAVKVTATLKPVVTVTIDGPETICNSGLPVIYTGNPSGGTFNLPGGLPQGAVTVNGNKLTVNPGTTLSSFTFSYLIAGANNCGGSASKSVTINNGGTTINLTPKTVCETQTLTYTDPDGVTGIWSGFGITDTGAGATFNAASALTQSGKTAPASVYIYYNQTNGACSRKDSALITISPKPVITIAGPETLCANNLPAQYTATPAGGTFTLPDGLPAGFATISGNVLTLNPGFNIISLSFSYKFTDAGGGCSATASKSITISPSPKPTVNSPTICAGTPTTLTVANCAGSVLWSNAATTSSIQVSPTVTTDYTVTCTVNGCEGTATAKVTVNPKPTITLSGEPACSNDLSTFTVNFTATQGATITADKGILSGSTVTGVPAGQTVQIIASLNGCTDTLTVKKDCNCPTVTPPTLTASPAVLCVGASSTLSASGCTGTVKFYSDQGLTTELINSTVSPTATKTYYATCSATGSSCVSQPAEVTVTVKPKPTVTVTATTCTPTGATFDIAFTATQGATITATKGTVSGNTITGIAAGETVQILVTLDGCKDSISVTKNCAPTCQAPTPTGTGAEVCVGTPATLTASGCTTGYTATWFSNASLTTQAGSGSPFTPPALLQTTDYYVACVKTDDPTCISPGVKVTATVVPKPTIGTIAATAATCTNANSDASFIINGISKGQRFSFATSQAGLAPYATATVLNGSTIAVGNLANPGTGAGQLYYVRVYSDKADCFRDTSLLVPFKDCTVPCVKPNAGPDVFICSPTTQVDLPDATAQQKWQAGANNTGGTIDPATGLVTGLTANGSYSFLLIDKAAGNTCADTVVILRGSITLNDITTCFDTLTLPPYPNGSWTVAPGNQAAVTPAGKVTGLTTPGPYAFTLTIGSCVSNLTVTKQNCGSPCPTIVTLGDGKDTLCSGYYGEAIAVKVGDNKPVKFVRFTSPQTSTSVYTGGTLLDTVSPTDSIASWPNGIPGSQFPANTGISPVNYYVYAISADTTKLPSGCRPLSGKTFTVLPLPKVTQSTVAVCSDSLTYQAKITLPAGTYTVTLARAISTIGNGPIPGDIIKKVTGVSGSTTFSLAVADSAAVVIVQDESTGCASASPVINPSTVSCDKLYDLALKKTISKKLAMVGEDLSYTIKVWNEGQGTVTGIQVTDPLNAGVEYVTYASAFGNYNPTTKIWTVGTLAAGDTATITIVVKVIAEGVWFNTAEITKMNEKDVDSTPGNGLEGEDDIDRACFTVPIILCQGQGESIDLTVPQQYSGVVWFRKVQGGQPVQVATGNTYTASETELGSYEYTFTSTAGSCPAGGCCPIIIAVQDCCPVQICVPVVMKRMRLPR